jgi:3,4-dihydroxy 2-butanone 4-phosphate synthase/GTP cyclohydrolase II
VWGMVDEAIQRVRLALANGEKPSALARKAGLHPNTLYGAEAPGWNPKASTLIALEPHLPELPDARAA